MPKSHAGFRYQPLLALVLLALASLACGSYSRANEQIVSTATSAVATNSAPGATTAPLPTPTIPPPTPIPAAFLGDTVELDGYSLTAITVEDPATRPGIFYEPQPGKKLIAVEFIVGNVAGEQFSSNVLSASLVDNDGFLYGAENTVVEDEIELLDVNAGERVRGWAAFFIPESATATTFKYEIHGTVLQVGLTPR